MFYKVDIKLTVHTKPCHELKCLNVTLYPGMSQEWFHRIMNLVPKKMQKNQREIKRINEEIKEDYAFAVEEICCGLCSQGA